MTFPSWAAVNHRAWKAREAARAAQSQSTPGEGPPSALLPDAPPVRGPDAQRERAFDVCMTQLRLALERARTRAQRARILRDMEDLRRAYREGGA